MAGVHIISVSSDPNFVLEVRQTGPSPLDVRLVGCDGETPYVTRIEHSKIASLKRKKVSDDEWEVILSYFLLQKQPEARDAALLDNVRIEHTRLKSGDIQITVWRDVQGIHMTLGQFELQHEPEEEIDPIDWACTSSQAHNATLAELAQLKAKLDSEQGTLAKLKAQFEDFLKAKDEGEAAMLQQFMALLNEKKRKIRDQARLLSGAKVDTATVSAVQSTREETKPRKPGPSRASKRKAPARAAAVVEESDEDQMEIDEGKAEEQDGESPPEAATPDHSVDDETDDDDEAAPSASQPNAKAQSAETTGGSTKATAAPPPRRELPFAKTRAARKEPSPPPADDSETEDEEL